MKAIQGEKVKNDKIDSQKIAALLRCAILPMAYVYPQGMRSTRDLLRRRLYLARQRAELQTHIQVTNTQYNFPPFEKRIERGSNRTWYWSTLHRSRSPHQRRGRCDAHGFSSRADSHHQRGRSTPRFLIATRWLYTCCTASQESQRSLLWQLHLLRTADEVPPTSWQASA